MAGILFSESFISGLSPLARGTYSHIRHGAERRRFIPAGAGNMGPAEPAPWLLPVYPRWRGEHELINLTISCAFGLSPLARGT